MIRDVQRPIIYAGGGIVSAVCADKLLTLAEKPQCPVTNTIMGHGITPPDHPLSLHVLSMY